MVQMESLLIAVYVHVRRMLRWDVVCPALYVCEDTCICHQGHAVCNTIYYHSEDVHHLHCVGNTGHGKDNRDW